MAQITLAPAEPCRLAVIFPYSTERLDKIRSVEGRRWDPDRRRWTVPERDGMIEHLKNLFKDDEVALTTDLLESQAIVDRIHRAVRALHYSANTGKIYAGWAQRFLSEHSHKNAGELGEPEVAAFLSKLANVLRVSASTQNQALHALIFLFEKVLGREVGMLDGVVRAKRPARLPVVLSRQEVQSVISQMHGTPRLMALLLYGAGLRLKECCMLRVKDLDFFQNQILVRGGKGNKDRHTMLPSNAQPLLREHLKFVERQHQEDLRAGLGGVALPEALGRKYPNAEKEWGWQWVFPATGHYTDIGTGQRRRHHLHESVLQRAFRQACQDHPARQLPHAPPFVRDASSRGRLRHPDYPRAPRPHRCEHHDD